MLAVCPDRSVPIHELVVKVLRWVQEKKTLLDTDSSDCDGREGNPKRDRRGRYIFEGGLLRIDSLDTIPSPVVSSAM